MASPSSSSGEEPRKNEEQITFRFCSECSNMLYPKEDPDTHRLQFACRTCQYSEEAVSSCVFRNVLNNAVGETAGVTQDVGSDPTLPRSNKTCPACRNEDAVFFQSQQRSAETGMVSYRICEYCQALLMGDHRNSSTYAAGAVISSNDTPGFDYLEKAL